MSRISANTPHHCCTDGRAAHTECCDSVIWFGNVDWWYHNRGHSSTRVAVRLARAVPTVYVNSIGMRMPVPGRTEIAWKRYRRKIGSLMKGLRRDKASGMWVYTPLFFPKYSKDALEFNGLLLAAQIRLIRRWLGLRRPSACVSMPTMVPAVERLDWTRVVFERCDDFTAMPGVDAPLVADLERRLLAISDGAAYVSAELYERERHLVADARLVGHGVDVASAVRARPLDGPRPEPPPAMRSLVRPIVGFFGGMDEYRMDVELMIKVAKAIAPGTMVLIGPEQMDLSRVKAEPNVLCLGQLAPDRLAEYAAHFDVGIIPFLRNDFNRRCSPIKLKEYLALGLPTVATSLPVYSEYFHIIYQANNHDEFLCAVRKAASENDPALALARRSAVAGDDWDAVASRFAGMLACADAAATPDRLDPPLTLTPRVLE
jgi:glycosyltransferase involved in cell wall biosynthesis